MPAGCTPGTGGCVCGAPPRGSLRPLDSVPSYLQTSSLLASDQHLQEQLRSDHDRLSALERATARQEEELKLILRAQIVLIHHIVDGNGVENLKAMQRQIEEFLVYGNNFTFHRDPERSKTK